MRADREHDFRRHVVGPFPADSLFFPNGPAWRRETVRRRGTANVADISRFRLGIYRNRRDPARYRLFPCLALAQHPRRRRTIDSFDRASHHRDTTGGVRLVRIANWI